jgi:plastocyanin
MRFSRAGAVAAALLLTVGAGACSSKSSTASTSTSTTAPAGSGTTAASGPATTAAPAAGGTTIAIQNFKFNPDPATFKVGDTVTVSNKDGTDHSLTANDTSFDTGVFSSGSKTITLSKAGTFSIHCKIHNFMTGTITVK